MLSDSPEVTENWLVELNWIKNLVFSPQIINEIRHIKRPQWFKTMYSFLQNQLNPT